MMGKSIQEDGTNCNSFLPPFWFVARCFQVADSVKFRVNYLLTGCSNDQSHYMDFVEYLVGFELHVGAKT
jgi:hypothetical protein